MSMQLLMMLVFLWCLWCTKPSYSSFLPSLPSTKVSSNLFRQKILQSGEGIMINAKADEKISLVLHDTGMVTHLPFLSPIIHFIAQRSALVVLTYILIANAIYLQRRSHLRKMTKRKLLQIRTTKEEGVELAMYIINIIAWQVFVTAIFPVLEPLSRLCGFVSFYYFYPNANGCGIIFEPLSVQHLPMKKRQRAQLRLDWHKFSVNIGNVGRDGFRHPPSVVRNLPHLDIPRLQMKHWPWRRKHKICDK